MALGRWTSVAVCVPEDEGLQVTCLRRRHGVWNALSSCRLRIKANVLADAVDVVAQELRDGLAEQGIHEKRWVLGVPASWVLSHMVTIPEAALDGVSDFLWLQAEQELPIQSERTALAVSTYEAVADGTKGATLFALAADRLRRFGEVLEQAGLRLVGAVPALVSSPAAGAAPTCVVHVRTGTATIQIDAGGGVVVLRSMPLTNGHGGAARDAELQRQIRIVIAQLPGAVASGLGTVRLLDDASRLQPLAAGVVGKGAGGLTCEAVPGLASASRAEATLAAVESGALSMFAAMHADSGSRMLDRGVLRIGALAAVLVLILGVALGQQLWTARSLARRLADIGPTAQAVESSRRDVQRLSTWFDRFPNSLAVLREITEAFPERGTVWVTRWTLTDGTRVQLAGRATDADEWLAMQEALREAPGIRNLRISQTRAEAGGGAGLSFSVSFDWIGRERR